MAITLTYASTRSEVWRWYWRAWRKKLWAHHAGYFALILVFGIALDGQWPPYDYKYVLGEMLAAAAVVALFVAFPQLVFKPQERKLTVSEAGLDTSIGRKSGTIEWSEIIAIRDTPDVIEILRNNGNAFLIPDRAFDSNKDRRDFLAAVRAWQARR